MRYAIYLGAALVLAVILTKLEIPLLRRLKAGQSIREDGPQSHLSKGGTPTMGGLAIIASAVGVSLAAMPDKDMLVMCGSMAAFGLVGFTDDWLKVVKRRNLGLRAWQKMSLLLIFSLLLAWYGYSKGAMVILPFVRTGVSFGVWYLPFAVFAILAMTNAVNPTDGLDGLASGVTALVALCMWVVSGGSGGVFSMCLSGACIGFFIFNKHPAKLFMGDTGSLALGGALAAIAVCDGSFLALPVAGGVYVAEALSVIIQVYVFKTQKGRRFFRMAPLHHHFEMGGMPETKVVNMFVTVTAMLCAAAMFMF